MAVKADNHHTARSRTPYHAPMRPFAVLLVWVLILSSLVPLLGGQPRDVQAASVPAWTKILHLHDGPDYISSNYFDWMNSTGPTNPTDTNYEAQNPPVDGISIRKNPSPNHKHYWVMYPYLSSSIALTGDLDAHLWARSKGNQSGTLITAIFYDMGPGQIGNPNLWTEIGRNTVPLVGPTYSDFNVYDIPVANVSYTLAVGHSLVLAAQRGDSFNDVLIIMFDETSKDSYVTLTTSVSATVDAAWTEDAAQNARALFSDLETIYVKANVSDPFGAYDIVGANVSASCSGNGTMVLPPMLMALNRTDPAQVPYWKTFELALPSLPHGTYILNVTASDHQGIPTWFTCLVTVVTVDHFGVSAPARIVAGENFTLTVTALDSSNATITNWVGTVSIVAYRPDKTSVSNGTLSVSSLVVSVGDLGQVTNSSVNYSWGNETILIRASSGVHIGWSAPVHVSSGPVVRIEMNIPTGTVAYAGSTVSLVATGFDSFNNVNSTWACRWNVTGGIGVIIGTGTRVSFGPSVIGTGNITCTDDDNGVNITIDVTVVGGTLARVDITVTFDPLQIPERETRVFVALGYDAAGNQLALANVTWDTNTSGSIQSIGSGPSALFTAGYLPESGAIHARKGNIIGTITVKIIDSSKGPSFSPIPPQYVTENTGAWQLNLNGYWHHPNGTASLTWWAENVNTSLFLISHAQSSNSVIQFYTQVNEFGDDTFDLWAVDQAGFRAHTTVTVHILHVNQAPEFVNNPPTVLYVKFDKSYIFDFSYYVRDVDNPKSDLILTSSSGRVFFDGLNATFLFPQKNGDQSYFEFVTLNLSDGHSATELKIVVWATTDTPPSLVKTIPDQSILEGTIDYPAFNLDDYFADLDNDTLFYSYGFYNVKVSIDSQTHEVLLSAPGEWSGTEEGIFTATDPTGALMTGMARITVIPVNDPPRIIQNIGTVFVKYNETYYLYLSPFVFDPDNSMDSLTFNISNPHIKEGTSVTGAHRLEMLFPPSSDPNSSIFTGPYTVTVAMVVSDPLGATSPPLFFQVRVTGDSPPQVSVPDPDQLYYSFPENSYLNGSLQLYNLFSDSDDSSLTFYLSGTEHVFARVFSNGDVNLSSTVNWSGMEALNVKAVDSHGAWSLVQVHITVTPVNQAPVIYPIPDIINRGAFRNAHYPIFQYIYDSDTPYSSLKITATPSGNAFVVGTNLYVSLPDGVDVITVTLQASDGKLSSNIVSFKVGVEKTTAEQIGWPYSFPLLLLGVGVAAFFVASRIPRPYALENLFLIHNDGRLVAHVTREENTLLDKDVVSAMFTAVQEFVRDSFQKGEVGLKKLEIGDRNVVIEKGHSAYLALIYSGWPTKETFDMLSMLMSDIEERYGERLGKWNGTAKTVRGAERMLQDYMSSTFQPGTWHEEEEIAEKEWVDILDKEA